MSERVRERMCDCAHTHHARTRCDLMQEAALREEIDRLSRLPKNSIYARHRLRVARAALAAGTQDELVSALTSLGLS